jgi:hypothetical protein
VTSSAGFGTAGVLTGNVALSGDSAIKFTSGEITSLAAHAQLHLNGNAAFVEDSKALSSNSALTGLASIGAGAILGLHNGASMSTTGSLVNDGNLRIDFLAGDGGSSLTVAGTLANSGDANNGVGAVLVIGNTTLSAPVTVTVTSLDNNTGAHGFCCPGSIYLKGSSANQALLDVTAGDAGFGTAGVLTGDVSLSGDSAIEFASGEITSLVGGAQLRLNGNDAFIEDSTALGSNSALIGLASISGACFYLENGASVSTTGALVDDGYIEIDPNAGDGGSSLTVGGTLTNSAELTTHRPLGAGQSDRYVAR